MTNALRRIRNAWHFYHALILVIKVVCGSIVLRCSPLKRALALRRKNENIHYGSCFREWSNWLWIGYTLACTR
ncbi:DUF3265 domain-containing protein [Vibrio cholerae]|nr:DUF3265 domain-containing protein [Vibrio cholerae]EGR4166756.1 DUF3265 domain-containing protein [Vibrio cholerae]EGR4173865.1 DUF3265 domain-containing protein [Vibrio cholerae]EGR4174060.1 DUF3265 domain-containing protein [Vibrio cholerae]EJK2100862.1 DUF3265 domain-containing protein [Vibrio cholerae]